MERDRDGYGKELRRIRWELSRLRQVRSGVEKRLVGSGAQMPGSVVWKRTYQRKKGGKQGKRFAYLSFSWGGQTRYRYIRQRQIEQVGKYTGTYRAFQAGLRELSRVQEKILALFRKVQQIQISRTDWEEIKHRIWKKGRKRRG